MLKKFSPLEGVKKVKIVIEVIPPNSSWKSVEPVIRAIGKSFEDDAENEITIEVKSLSFVD